MKYLSLFSGIGGFELGIQQAYDNRPNLRHRTQDIQENVSNTKEPQVRPTCVGYSEIDKYAVQIYEKHFNHKNYGDITEIDERKLPTFEMLVGGFPCQAFSIAGKRGGFADTRGTLFFEIARIVREKQPRLLLLENVKGLLSHDQGRTFYTIISTLDELGYDCQWQVLNSKNHGVPQNRERVFIIGHLRGTPRPEVFPFGEATGTTCEGFNKKDTQIEVTQTLRSRYGNGSGSHIQQLNKPKHSNDRVYGTEGLSPTLNTMQGGRRQPKIATNGDLRVKQSVLRTTETIIPQIRRLTPKECERLQGFPDNWTKYGKVYTPTENNLLGEKIVEISDTQRYKTIGNAVTVNVIKDIMEKLMV